MTTGRINQVTILSAPRRRSELTARAGPGNRGREAAARVVKWKGSRFVSLSNRGEPLPGGRETDLTPLRPHPVSPPEFPKTRSAVEPLGREAFVDYGMRSQVEVTFRQSRPKTVTR
ncbi:hypothetical protein CMV_026681 [Castanea mollissima]|uniref:Uncharacterized protein n=1 Tax=Castanea mollissima TaxID=60419 RepID=A0A8J4QJK3_9ROSI|nr:hypothetical protein CMV_026681 [Castanea mollissima]